MVHALVRLRDGAALAHLGYPDMRVPISYALTYPERAKTPVEPLDLASGLTLEFGAPDLEAFPCLALAQAAGEAGGTAPASSTPRTRSRWPRSSRASLASSASPRWSGTLERGGRLPGGRPRRSRGEGRRGPANRRGAHPRPGSLGADTAVNIAVAIGGLAFLILIHEAGHFFTALAVKMRPRKFYIFFPPALAKWHRNGIEYGSARSRSAATSRFPGCTSPRPGTSRPTSSRREGRLPPGRRGGADRAGPCRGALRRGAGRAVRASVEVAGIDLSRPARRAADRGPDVDDALSPEAYWRAPTWKRIAVIFAGPATNYVFAVLALAVVFMLGVPTGATRVVEGEPGLPRGRDGVAAGRRDHGGEQDGRRVRRPRRGDPRERRRARDPHGRAGRAELQLEGTPQLDPTDDVYQLGFAFGLDFEGYGPLEAIGLAFETTWEVTKAIVSSLGRLVTGSGREGGKRRRHHHRSRASRSRSASVITCRCWRSSASRSRS